MSEPSDPGAIDLAQFHRVFFEETEEHLASLETLLVTIDIAAPSSEDLNAIFRAAHSIKGGSGTFGFREMTEVTHELESMLDRVRKQELVLRTDMVDVLLAASDLLGEQLACYRDAATPPGGPVTAMCARIRACMAPAAGPVAAAAATPGPPAVPPGGPVMRELELCFVPPPDAHSSLDGLAEELGELGTVTVVAAAPRAKQRRFRITTAASDDDIRSRFAFLVDPASVAIVPCAPAGPAVAAPAAAAPPAPAAEDDRGFGFFDNAPGAPASAAADPGYGFFVALPERAAEAAAGAAAEGAPPTPGEGAGPAIAEGFVERRREDRRGSAADSSIRVGIEKVDNMINLVGELVITQAMVAQTASALDPVAFERLTAGLSQLARNTRDLQDAVMSVRMMPIAVVFNRFPRVVRDVAGKLGKQVELKTEGEGTELDKGLIEKIADPLTHLIRNSLDHGIETPAQRVAAGKSAAGTITLRAFHRGGNIVIEVADDGAGLNRDRILAKARQRGMDVHDGMTDQEVWLLIFEAGLSTAEVVTDVSGRGVGMDVVRRNIRDLGGRVEVDSAPGVGTRISIRLPLTLAILDGMSVGVSGETFILPLNHVVESLQVADGDVHSIAGAARVISVRGAYVPVVVLKELFGLPASEGGSGSGRGVMVILESDGETIAVLVDELLGQHQVVIKSLESNYRRVAGISGATIMGDGRVAMILDVPGMLALSRL